MHKLRFPLLLLVVILLFLVVSNFRQRSVSTQEVKIYYTNSSDVVVYDISEALHGGEEELVSKISQSGQTVQLNKDRGYAVSYKGNMGYESGSVTVSLPKQTEVSIDPHFTREKLDTLLPGEEQGAQQALRNTYSNIGLYEMQKGKLYHFGDWYGTTLKYIGTDQFNSDTLRVVLKKENGVWVVKTDPPNITLSKFIYPDVPEDILRDVNNFL